MIVGEGTGRSPSGVPPHWDQGNAVHQSCPPGADTSGYRRHMRVVDAGNDHGIDFDCNAQSRQQAHSFFLPPHQQLGAISSFKYVSIRAFSV